MIRRNLNKLTSEGRQRNQEADVDYENAPDSQPLETLLTDDREILGTHARQGMFRDTARKKADKLVEKIDHAEEVQDVVTIREKYFEARRNFTQTRINKLTDKSIDSIDDNFFTQRLKAWRREKLKDLKAVNEKRTKFMGKIEKTRLEKPERLRQKIDLMVKKKVDAMYRKAQRVELRRKGIGWRDQVKRAEFLAKLTPQDKKRIVGEAIAQARKKSIELGRLDRDYSIDTIDVDDDGNDLNYDDIDIRKVTDDYGRIVK